jgi:hypothetical protein
MATLCGICLVTVIQLCWPWGTGDGLLGAKVSLVSEKNYLMQFILHISGKN